MRTTAAIITVLLLVASCSTLGKVGGKISGTSPVIDFTADPIIHTHDTGGNPFEYQEIREKLIATGKEVRLGECHSACTMLLSMPNACMIPGMKYGFHSANIGAFNRTLEATYRAGVLEQFREVWSKSDKLTFVWPRDLIKLDPQLKFCK